MCKGGCKCRKQSVLTTQEQQLVKQFLLDYLERLSCDSCNDWDFPKGWTKSQKEDLYARVRAMNPDNYDDDDDDDQPQLFNTDVVEYLASLL